MEPKRISIPIKGINRISSDKVSEDGDSQEIINARYINRAWRPVGDKVELYNLGSLSLFDNIYKHPVLPAGYYVGSKLAGSAGLHVIHDNTFEAQFLGFSNESGEVVVKIDHVGTILRCVTQGISGSYWIYLCKYDLDSDAYVVLEDIPRPRVSFLQDASGSSPATAKIGNSLAEAEGYYYETLAGFKQEGYVEGNVLFRLAYRLFDGSFIMHSQPYNLYLGNDPTANPLEITDLGGGTFQFSEIYVDRPKMKFTFHADFNFNGYEGIITSLCIFMTPPVTHWNIGNYNSDVPFNPEANGGVSGLVENGSYYLIHEIPLDDLAGTSDYLFPNLSDIENLVAKTALPVDNFSNHKIFGINSLLFNDRLHQGNVNTVLGPSLDLFLWQINNPVVGFDDFEFDEDLAQGAAPYFLRVFLRTDEGDRIVEKSPIDLAIFEDQIIHNHKIFLGPILTYPDDRAYKIELWHWDGDVTYVIHETWDLVPHPFYNFSYYANYDAATNTFKYIDILTSAPGTPAAPADISNQLEDTNRIQVTETNNIFVMPAANSYQVDNKENIILGLAAMGEPVSEGQFGVYPLYVFTSKGIWILQQGTGLVLYQSIQPISREVCVNPASILPLGQSVLFATIDSLKVIASRSVDDISDPVEGKVSLHISSNDDYETYLSSIFLVELIFKVTANRFKNFLTTAIFAYDQVNREIIVSNPNDSSISVASDIYSYVFNLKTSTWHKISDTWDQFLNNYPGFIGINDTVLYDMAVEDTTTYPHVMIQTRPIKLETGYKKIINSILRGHFIVKAETFAGLYLFATQDNERYHLLNGRQSDGTFDDFELGRNLISSRSFIFLFAGQLSQDTEITHLDINYLPRFKRKMR